MVDPSGFCGEVYTGNIDLNTSINQRCYELAETFANELAAAGIEPNVDISEYNIDVIYNLRSAWRGRHGFPQIIFPNPDTLPVGQPFEIIGCFNGFPDPTLALLDGSSGGLTLAAIISLEFPLLAGAFEFGSGFVDVATIFYLVTNDKVALQKVGGIGAEATADLVLDVTLDYEKMLELQKLGIIPFLGAAFDLDALNTQFHKGSVLKVTPIPEYYDQNRNSYLNYPRVQRPELINRGF